MYDNVKKKQLFIINLGKCTQIDARPLPDSIYKEYLNLFEKEINNRMYHFYLVFYPAGNCRFNIDKSIEDIKWIIKILD